MWRRSSVCGNESECVEVAVCEGRVLARDSKNTRANATGLQRLRLD